MDPDLKREIMIDNYTNPFNKETKNDKEYIKTNGNIASCIDDINLFIKIEEDILYRVMSGSYANKANAERQVEKLKSFGFDAVIMPYKA